MRTEQFYGHWKELLAVKSVIDGPYCHLCGVKLIFRGESSGFCGRLIYETFPLFGVFTRDLPVAGSRVNFSPSDRDIVFDFLP